MDVQSRQGSSELFMSRLLLRSRIIDVYFRGRVCLRLILRLWPPSLALHHLRKLDEISKARICTRDADYPFAGSLTAFPEGWQAAVRSKVVGVSRGWIDIRLRCDRTL